MVELDFLPSDFTYTLPIGKLIQTKLQYFKFALYISFHFQDQPTVFPYTSNRYTIKLNTASKVDVLPNYNYYCKIAKKKSRSFHIYLSESKKIKVVYLFIIFNLPANLPKHKKYESMKHVHLSIAIEVENATNWKFQIFCAKETCMKLLLVASVVHLHVCLMLLFIVCNK